MVKMIFTPEEIQEAIEAIPDGWGWYNLAMVNSDPTTGHKVHHSHAVMLVKAGVIGRVPNSGDPQDGRQGPWYAVTKLGELVAEAVGLWLVKEGTELGCEDPKGPKEGEAPSGTGSPYVDAMWKGLERQRDGEGECLCHYDVDECPIHEG